MGNLKQAWDAKLSAQNWKSTPNKAKSYLGVIQRPDLQLAAGVNYILLGAQVFLGINFDYAILLLKSDFQISRINFTSLEISAYLFSEIPGTLLPTCNRDTKICQGH